MSKAVNVLAPLTDSEKKAEVRFTAVYDGGATETPVSTSFENLDSVLSEITDNNGTVRFGSIQVIPHPSGLRPIPLQI